jgi:hypothetical protein
VFENAIENEINENIDGGGRHLENQSYASAVARGNVVWAVLPSYGERVNFGPPPEQKPSNRSRPNLASVITSQGSPNVSSLVDVTSPAAARRRGGLSRLCDFFPTFFCCFFPGSRTAHTDSPIIIVDGSNNPVWCKEVPFVQKCQEKFHLRGTIPEKWGNFPENRHFPA